MWKGSEVQILFINHDGGGFAAPLDVPAETTVTTLFSQHVGGEPGDYLIRVNRQPATADQVLCDGDRVTITPLKIEGA
jgi:sulfur carrier protein ThiS